MTATRRTAVDAVSSHACCRRDRCREGPCRAHFPSQGKTECISGSEYQSNHKWTEPLADCLLFWTHGADDALIAVELKGGAVDASEGVSQLQQAARLGSRLAKGVPIQFFPLLVHAGKIASNEIKQLRKAKVRFRGEEYSVLPVRTPAKVEEVIRMATSGTK